MSKFYWCSTPGTWSMSINRHNIDGFMQRDITPLLMHWGHISFALSHWGRVTYICVGKLTIFSLDNGLSPDRHHAIISTNDGIFLTMLIGPLGTNFSQILIKINTMSFKKMHLKMSSDSCCEMDISSRPQYVKPLICSSQLAINFSPHVLKQLN